MSRFPVVLKLMSHHLYAGLPASSCADTTDANSCYLQGMPRSLRVLGAASYKQYRTLYVYPIEFTMGLAVRPLSSEPLQGLFPISTVVCTYIITYNRQ